MRVAAAVVAVFLLAEGGALARKPHKKAKRPKPAPTAGADAEGRSHLKKANALASHDDCEAAIAEYTLAFDRLNDPAVLLARADCRQRLNQNAEAVEDYRAYLDESPDVSNRAEIEAKIAALEESSSKLPAAKESPAPKEVVRSKEPPPTEREPPPTAPKQRPPGPEAADSEVAPPREPARAAGAVLETKPASGRTEAPTAIRHVWMWTALAVLIAGGAAAAGYFYFRPAPNNPPATELGNYHF